MPTPAPAASSQDDPIAIAIEKAVNRAVLAEEKVKLYEEKLIAKDDRIAAMQMQIDILKSQKGDLGEAGTLRKEARALDLERIADRDKLIAKQDAEIDRLRHPGFFASIFDTRTFGGAIAGYGACKLTSGGTSLPSFGSSSSSSFFNISRPAPIDFSLFQTSADGRVREALKRMQKGSN